MSTTTFDLFDAALGDAYNYCQSLPDEMRFMNYRREFTVDPLHWDRYSPPTWEQNLVWQEYQYSKVHRKSELEAIITSTEPGIYIFYVRPNRLINRFPQFALYVGISNERGSNRPLRDRLGDYFPGNLSIIQKRKNLHRMLQLYYGSVWVTYAHSTRSSTDLKDLEQSLHDYIYPCFADRDFSPGIKDQQKGFGRR